MRALGAYVFAGGFTLGVREEFDVLGHLEESDYGVATVRRNMPGLPVAVGVDRWGPFLKDLGGCRGVDFLYGNPPCAAWSAAGTTNAKDRDWTTDPRVDCARRHFGILEELRPRAWAWESVPQAFEVGRPLVDEFTARAVALGYSVTYLLHNSEFLGVPQRRRRFFMVATDRRFDVEDPDWTSSTSCDDALRVINAPGTPIDYIAARYPELIPHVRPGEDMRRAWIRQNPEMPRNERGNLRRCPPFVLKRHRPGQPAYVVIAPAIHPTESRELTVEETAALCGFPPGYEFVTGHEPGGRYGGHALVSLIARGVCPPVGAWLARLVKRCIENDVREEPTVQLVDLRAAPGIRVRPLKPGSTVAADSSLYAGLRAPESDGASSLAVAAVPSAPATRGPTIRPKPGVGSGLFMRFLMMTGQWSQDGILRLVHASYPMSTATRSDVAYNKSRLRREGYQVPPFGSYT